MRPIERPQEQVIGHEQGHGRLIGWVLLERLFHAAIDEADEGPAEVGLRLPIKEDGGDDPTWVMGGGVAGWLGGWVTGSTTP